MFSFFFLGFFFFVFSAGVMKKIFRDFADVLAWGCYTHLCGMLDVYQYNDRKSSG